MIVDESELECRNRLPGQGHSWYTTKRRIDVDITFCWECGEGWVPDNGLLTDAEIQWPEPPQWLQASGLRWMEAEHAASVRSDSLSGQDSNLQPSP